MQGEGTGPFKTPFSSSDTGWRKGDIFRRKAVTPQLSYVLISLTETPVYFILAGYCCFKPS